jgi:general stress protein 26
MHAKTTEEFREDLEEFDTAMLVTRDGPYLRSRPMQPHVGNPDGSIRFLSSARAHKVEEIDRYPEANAVFTDDDFNWISVSGRIRLSRDAADIEELWSPAAEAWITEGKGEAVVLIMEPEIAEYWDYRENAVKAGWEIAKGALTGKQPDIGEHDKLRL